MMMKMELKTLEIAKLFIVEPDQEHEIGHRGMAYCGLMAEDWHGQDVKSTPFILSRVNLISCTNYGASSPKYVWHLQ
jgi:hypothetical protein